MRMTKQSMREIPAAAQDEIRKRVIVALNNGLSQAEASRIFGIPDRSIRRWVAQMRREGVASIEPKRRGRVAGEVSELKPRQAERIRALVIGKMPDQLKLPFYLWTREAVGQLIEREYGIKVWVSYARIRLDAITEFVTFLHDAQSPTNFVAQLLAKASVRFRRLQQPRRKLPEIRRKLMQERRQRRCPSPDHGDAPMRCRIGKRDQRKIRRGR